MTGGLSDFVLWEWRRSGIWRVRLAPGPASFLTTAMNCSLPVGDEPPCFPVTAVPFYFSPKSRLISDVSDVVLALIAPLIAYWVLSLFFHYLDMSGWTWLDKYRIHESSEVKSRNLATRSQVVWAVILQQIIQTAIGLIWLGEEKVYHVNHVQELEHLADIIKPSLLTVLGADMNPIILVRSAQVIYWWGIPAGQLLAAMCDSLSFTPTHCLTSLFTGL